jgi:hypothetical protein
LNEQWPNLFVPGAGKSGTSSLHAYLDLHPLIAMSKEKEPSFFTDTKGLTKRKTYYLDLFKSQRKVLYRGESSTGYMGSLEAIKNIKAYITQPKLIFILRNPIDRAFSHFRWMTSLGYEKRDFEEAINSDIKGTKHAKTSVAFGSKHYYQEGLYAKWISRYINAFGKQNIYIITSERLREIPLHTLNSCFHFLGIDALSDLQPINLNPTSGRQISRRYRLTNYLLFGKHLVPIKRAYSAILPGRIRIFIRQKISALQEHTANTDFHNAGKEISPVLSPSQRDWLKDLYAEEVNNLKGITGNEYQEWRDFN